MRFSIRFADKIVGALVVLALAILVVVIFMIGRSQRWFKYDYHYISYFQSASGLSKNMPVQYKGFVIGYVKDFKLADDDTVEATFTIFEEYRDRWVKDGSLVEVVASPIGLGNSFIFYPGTGINILDEYSLIPDIYSVEGKRFIAAGMTTKTDSEDSISNIMNQVNELLENINLSLSAPPGSENLPLSQTLRYIEDVTRGLADPNGTIMRALDGDGPIYNELISMLRSVSGILEDINRSTHVLPSQLPVILNDLSIGLREIQDLLVAISNNPLLKGGIPERVETGPGGASQRNLEF
ncbi:MAG: MlaD family protein [Treponema sp.]|jgi:phospholipid/cholesterol/gamma-HCH transport system substrate-binding protein|nr:MlaD family protein [Treponema sp.]